ncbi:MAG TPA: aromatic-ring-hydroxylating dioxygenase subunit beta [Dehalococcoidia bacterium]|nr:aromatic-ring-hydroxylating dioxygenase subunit beta [Dehalococcoidia bacterium]
MAFSDCDIENFLYREARLLDEHRYEEWESLWTDDGAYWVPCNEDDHDPLLHVSIIYDDRNGISRRVQRLTSDTAWSYQPRPRLLRLVSNIETEAIQGGEITVHSNFNLTELRGSTQALWTGKSLHRLRGENGKLRMSFKKVVLINNDVELPVMAFLV